jgi:hypothetical protein
MNVHLLNKKKFLLSKKIFRITQMAEGNAATLIPVPHEPFKMIKDTSDTDIFA